MAKKRKKAKPGRIDGLSTKDIANIRRAVRQVWSWSTPWRLTKARAVGKDGFPRCEKCRKKVPKVFVDHIDNVGAVDDGFIRRMFVPSKYLQALCKRCHDAKTRQERALLKQIEIDDFY
jgi:hypothetical protein